jgi:hypothetical protein
VGILSLPGDMLFLIDFIVISVYNVFGSSFSGSCLVFLICIGVTEEGVMFDCCSV